MRKYLAFFIFIFSACVNQPHFGVYSSKKNAYKITINKDSTYTFEWLPFEHNYVHSDGHWKSISKKKLRFQSTFQSKIVPIVYKEDTTLYEPDSVALQINTNIPAESKAYYSLAIFIDEKYFASVKCDSLLSNTSLPLPKQSIYFKIIADGRHIPIASRDTLKTAEYVINKRNISTIHFGININFGLFNYKVINGEIVKFRGHKLIYNFLKLRSYTRKKYTSSSR